MKTEIIGLIADEIIDLDSVELSIDIEHEDNGIGEEKE